MLSHDPTDATVLDVIELASIQNPNDRGLDHHSMANTDSGGNSVGAEDKRNRIANEMWAQYQSYIANKTVN